MSCNVLQAGRADWLVVTDNFNDIRDRLLPQLLLACSFRVRHELLEAALQAGCAG